MFGVSRPVVVIVAVLAAWAVALAPSSVQAAGSPPVPLPSKPSGLKPSVKLPSTLDPAAAYVPQNSCYPVDKPGSTKLRSLLLKTYKVGASAGISRGCTEGLSEHSEGRAVDWMVNVKNSKQKAAAADFLSWATRNNGENARRLGIMYMIYNKKIWAIYRAKEGWRPSSGHTDHIHISLSWNGARGNTSFWTGKVSAVDRGPCVRYRDSMGSLQTVPRTGACPAVITSARGSDRGRRVYGQKNSSTVRVAQRLLKITQTSDFDSATFRAVWSYQLANDLPRTGLLDEATWSSLDPGTIDRSVIAGYDRAEAIEVGRTQLRSSSYRPWVAGKGVAIMQLALGMPERQHNGYFGPQTLAAIKALQKRAGLKVDGVMAADEWKALQQQAR